MTPTSRRIFIYWLLLLVSALGVGGGAWTLLRREEARLAGRASSAEAARLAGLEARSRLVAENAELLVGDVDAGLLDTLAEVPREQLDAFLDRWERENPLVRTAFRATIDGTLLRPGVQGASAEERGFRRRFTRMLAENPPWKTVAPVVKEAELKDAASVGNTYEARRQIALNVANVQKARRETQELANARMPGYARSRSLSSAPITEEADRKVAAERTDQAVPSTRPPDQRGWWSGSNDGRFQVLGWVQPTSEDQVRGLELELTVLVARLGGVLPSEVASDEGYALRDEKGRILHQVGRVPAQAAPSARVPLASALVPRWEVVGWLDRVPAESGSDAFFLVGSLLTGILIVAILAGGSLLLWQARRSEADAVQKTSFVANVSHEFKTPLTTIRLYAELLEQGRVAEGEKRNEYLQTIGRETQRLSRLVNNVLDFSRLEQGRKKFQREPLELASMLAQVLKTLEPRVAEAGLELKREMPGGPLATVTDRDAVEQIVLNLVDNACKYATEGGEVMVALRPRTGGGAELSVLDRGPGVPSVHGERIFQKFHRVDDTLTAEKSGAGLGLSIARQLARGLGGELRYESRVRGGAAFILELP